MRRYKVDDIIIIVITIIREMRIIITCRRRAEVMSFCYRHTLHHNLYINIIIISAVILITIFILIVINTIREYMKLKSTQQLTM